MANLDDFFAKKDKKRSKTKKFLTPEEIAKKLEDTSKKIEQQQPSKSTRKEETDKTETTAAATSTDANEQEENNLEQPEQTVAVPVVEEEWKDFEEVERKDYSGLKIGQMTVNDEENDLHNSGQEDEEYGSDGEVTLKDSKHGPWKHVVPAEEVTQIPVEIEKPTSKIYISPAFKNVSKPSQKLRNRNAPDITNAEYFPTLGAARPEEQRKKKNEPAFEEVRHGGRMQKVQEVQQNTPVVGNRFRSLEEDDS